VLTRLTRPASLHRTAPLQIRALRSNLTVLSAFHTGAPDHAIQRTRCLLAHPTSGNGPRRPQQHLDHHSLR
jgi:hypothetical protein